MQNSPTENHPSEEADSGSDMLHTFLAAGDTVRGAVLDATRMVRQMRQAHELGILEALVLGHAYMGVCLMSAGLKGRDRLQLTLDCSGPIKGLVAEANADGDVRGFLKQVPIPVEAPVMDANLSSFFGAGFLSVTRTLEEARQPFTGRVMLAHGNLAQDLAHYYLTSEQIPTSFSLSVKFDRQGAVDAAGGLFLQAMPDADDTVIGQLADRVTDLPSIGMALVRGESPSGFVRRHLEDFSPRFIDRRPVAFNCHCNREQIYNLLRMMPLEELRDIQAKGPFPVSIRCHHCNMRYAFDRDAIDRIVAARFADN